MRTTNQEYRTETTVLAIALELANNSWKVALDDGCRSGPRIKRCDADQAADRFFEVRKVIEQTREDWELADPVRMVIGYEAGQDGFWLARALEDAGYEAVVIDPASIPVERHRRRRKTDRLDAIRLVVALRRWLRGERDAMRAVRIPDVELEDQRWQSRDRKQLQKEGNQHRDRIRKLLRTQGCWQAIDQRFGDRLERGEIRDWRGLALGAGLRARVGREWLRLEQIANWVFDPQMIDGLIPCAQTLDGHLWAWYPAVDARHPAPLVYCPDEDEVAVIYAPDFRSTIYHMLLDELTHTFLVEHSNLVDAVEQLKRFQQTTSAFFPYTWNQRLTELLQRPLHATQENFYGLLSEDERDEILATDINYDRLDEEFCCVKADP